MTPGLDRDPPFTDVGIVGLGLIGGSIALGIRSTWPSVRITGVDRVEVLGDAARQGAIDAGSAALSDLNRCDLIVLAAPVQAILSLVAEAGAARLTAVVTDVGSTKRLIMEASARAGLGAFIGGHPIAGAEHPGFPHARPDLFAGRPWMLVCDNAAGDAGLVALERFVRGLGAEPRRVDATSHDRTMAYLSHLPQLLAVALMTAAGDACGEDGLSDAGRAFREMTRLASSPSDVWRGILATNGDFVAEALDTFTARLPAAGTLADGPAIDALFAAAREWRARLHELPARPV
jgi:prephenate dehydrogenase